ncbi:MAG: 4-(cytidine 5'-diphospho)-2-C-methyl-D-erythritol kinase [Desulfovermiculus sp.]
MPQTITLDTGCKANLYLRILGRREDGYHDLQSLFVPLAQPSDRLTIGVTSCPGLVLTCTHPDLSGEENTVHRAYIAFTRQTGWRPGVSVHLEKDIPHGAGLGGGSADAAALLTHLNAMCPQENRLTHTELLQVAQEVGADVPFFLTNTPAWVQGTGEQVRPVSLAYTSAWVLVVCPDVHISTAEAFRAWDQLVGQETTHLQYIPEGHFPPDVCSRGQVLWNAFEPVVFPIHPKLAMIKAHLLGLGARGAVLSGSGGALVGLFCTYEQAIRAADVLEGDGTKIFISPLASCGVMNIKN